MVMPKCPNCNVLYRFYIPDDREYLFMLKHVSPTCPYGLISYQDTKYKCVKDVREHFKVQFPWKYPDARKKLS